MTDKPSHEQYLAALHIIAAYDGHFQSQQLFGMTQPGFGNPVHWHRHLMLVPRRIDASCQPHEIEVLDCDKTPLAVLPWHERHDALDKMLRWNAICPGGATYVIRGSDSIIRRSLAVSQRVEKFAQETRIDDLPSFAKGRVPSSRQKQQIGDDLLAGITLDDMEL